MGLCCSNLETLPGHSYGAWKTLGPSDRLKLSYKVGETLNYNTRCVVHQARVIGKKERKAVAIKSVDKASTKRSALDNEVTILSAINHPNILSLSDIIEDTNYLHLITELCNGGDLCREVNKFGPFSEEKAANWLRTACEVLGYLHQLGICHRDIKPENFLVSRTGDIISYKLADFGLSTLDGEQLMTEAVGTMAYAAPEVLNKKYTLKCDIWSLGVTLYTLLLGKRPFQAQKPEELAKKILYEDLPINHRHLSANAIDLLKNMMNRDTQARISLEEILNHPWLALSQRTNILDETLDTISNFSS